MPLTHLHKDKIIAVVVTYNPDLKILEQLLDTLDVQVESVVIIDNGSNVDLQNWINELQKYNIQVKLLGENRGIAAAHNVGIRWALNRGAENVLLMDQDSIPALEMVHKLRNALYQAKRIFDSPAIAAGPICVDMRSGNKSFFVTERYGIPSRWWQLKDSAADIKTRKVSTLISSGTLIDLKALQDIGGMRSNYFIDHVDTEWCFRAAEKGYILLGVPSAEMSHTLGDEVKFIWFFGWRNVAYHSPLRDYYMFRNTLLIFRDVKLSILWQLHLTLRLFKFFVYFLVFAPLRVSRLNLMVLGIIHGLRGKSGRLDLKTGMCTNIPKSDLDP